MASPVQYTRKEAIKSSHPTARHPVNQSAKTNRKCLNDREGLAEIPQLFSRILLPGDSERRRRRTAPRGPQIVAVFGERVFNEETEVKRGHHCY